jgi:hypothetical protein
MQSAPADITPFVLSEFLGTVARTAGGVWRVDITSDARRAAFSRQMIAFVGGSQYTQLDEYIVVVQAFSASLLSTYLFLTSTAVDEDARQALLLYVGYMTLRKEALHDALLPAATAMERKVVAGFAAEQELLVVFARREPAQRYIVPFFLADRSILHVLQAAPDPLPGIRRRGDTFLRGLAYCALLLQLYTHMMAMRRAAPDYVNGRLSVGGLYLAGGDSGPDNYTVYVLRDEDRLMGVVMPLWATDYYQLKTADLSLAGGTTRGGQQFGTRSAALASPVSDAYALAAAAGFALLDTEAEQVAATAPLLGEFLVNLVDPYYSRELVDPAYLAAQQRFFSAAFHARTLQQDPDAPKAAAQLEKHAAGADAFAATKALVDFMRSKRAGASDAFKSYLTTANFLRAERYYDATPAFVERAYAACAAAADREQNQHATDYMAESIKIMGDVARVAPSFVFTVQVPAATTDLEQIKAALAGEVLLAVDRSAVHKRMLFKADQRLQTLRYVFLFD